MTFDPMSVEVTCVTLPKDHCVQIPWEYINVCGYSDQFCKLPHTYIHILRTYYVQNERSHSLLLNSVQGRQQPLPYKLEKNSYPLHHTVASKIISRPHVYQSLTLKTVFFSNFVIYVHQCSSHKVNDEVAIHDKQM